MADPELETTPTTPSTSLRFPSRIPEDLRRPQVPTPVQELRRFCEAHRIYGEDLYKAFKASTSQGASSALTSLDFGSLFETYDSTSRMLSQGIEKQISTLDCTLRNGELLDCTLDELKEMTMEGVRKQYEEREAVRQVKLKEEEEYDRLQALGLAW